jgi:hypothetical protein
MVTPHSPTRVKIIPPENAALQKNSFQKCGTAESLLSECGIAESPL